MNSPVPSSFEATSNESIVITGGKRRPNLSNLDSAMLSTSTRHLSQKSEPSLYPDITNLPTIDTADSIWASTSRAGRQTINGSKASTTNTSTSKEAKGVREGSVHDTDESCTSVESVEFKRKTVEVTPGHFVPLRGADETLMALDEGQVSFVTCIFCDIALVVHAASSMFICPECEMIAPLIVDHGDAEKPSLGLGLRLDTLQLSRPDEDEGNSLVEETVMEKFKRSNLKRDPDEDSLSS